MKYGEGIPGSLSSPSDFVFSDLDYTVIATCAGGDLPKIFHRFIDEFLTLAVIKQSYSLFQLLFVDTVWVRM